MGTPLKRPPPAILAGGSLGLIALLGGMQAGCSGIGGYAGAAAGIASSAVTANPAVGYGIGIGVKAGTDAALKRFFRNWQQAEQDEIATLIGRLAEGDSHPWSIRHPLPYGNEQGELRVTRVIKTPLVVCKEALFSVVEGEGEKRVDAWYTVTACPQTSQWKWAVAEPAVSRWGFLQ